MSGYGPADGNDQGGRQAADPYPQQPAPDQQPAGYASYPPAGQWSAAPQPGQAPYGAPAGGGYGSSPGPLGTPRSIGVCILLSIVTLGIYSFVWTFKTYQEMKDHTGDGIGGGIGLLLHFLAGIVTYFLVPMEAEKMLSRTGQQSRVSAVTGCWVFLPLVGPIVWFVKVQGQLNDYWRSLGAQG